MRGVDRKETMGLGFSVWLEEAELKKGRKLRDLKGPQRLTSSYFSGKSSSKTLARDMKTGQVTGSRLFSLTEIGEKQPLLMLGLVPLQSHLLGLLLAGLAPPPTALRV